MARPFQLGLAFQTARRAMTREADQHDGERGPFGKAREKIAAGFAFAIWTKTQLA